MTLGEDRHHVSEQECRKSSLSIPEVSETLIPSRVQYGGAH